MINCFCLKNTLKFSGKNWFILSGQLKLQLVKKIAEKFEYEDMTSEEVYSKIKKPPIRVARKTARIAPINLGEYKRALW